MTLIEIASFPSHDPASSIQQVGSDVLNINYNFSGSPTVTLVADTGNEAISIRVTGVAAATINWHIAYNVIVEPE